MTRPEAPPQDRKRKVDGTAAEGGAGPSSASGSLIAQFETAEGEKTGPNLDVPVGTTCAQLGLILNELLQHGDGEHVPYSFYVDEDELTGTLGDATAGKSTERALRVVYVPQAVFRVRSVTRCTSTLPGHAEAVLSSSFAPDGRTLATGSGDHSVRLWDSLTETPKATLKAHRDWVLCVAWSPCGRFIASGGKDGKVAVWDAAKPDAPLRTIDAHRKWVNALAWEPFHKSADCVRLVSASKDGVARVWDRVSGRCVATLAGHAASVACVRWGGEGLVYTGSHDRTIKARRTAPFCPHVRRRLPDTAAPTT